MLAAHLNRFEILQMLLRKDATIEKPHKHSCICEVGFLLLGCETTKKAVHTWKEKLFSKSFTF